VLPTVTLVVGGEAVAREAAIAGRLSTVQRDGAKVALILEAASNPEVPFDPNVHITRLAPGCPCCTGNLVMKVTLNRILRNPPAHLFISIADATHLDAIRQFLTQPPYDTLLKLSDNLVI
jgi:hypothetical protein